jgi:SAM-dependent MidA family methyltransferase
VTVEELVAAEVTRRGPIPFAEVVDLALYDPTAGFYASGGHAGRRGDFLTSPEVGALFGAVVARALDTLWEVGGAPDVFTVVEAGAGHGALARSVLAAVPRCAPALRYVLVERSARQRATHAQHLALDAPAFAFAGRPDDDDDESMPPVPAAVGPIVVSLSELPRVSGPCIVLANELLDNLPFGLLERTADGWAEVCVGLEEDRLVEALVPAEHPPALEATVGARIPDQTRAGAWVRDARQLAAPNGRVIAFDYASTTAEMATRPWTEWVRTYRSHARGGHPLARLGDQDITCEVAVDQLPALVRDVSQADWLRANGIDDLVEEGRDTWRDRASIGDLAAVRARSRVTEAEALLDPAGLGGFRVLEWDGC